MAMGALTDTSSPSFEAESAVEGKGAGPQLGGEQSEKVAGNASASDCRGAQRTWLEALTTWWA